MAQFNRTTINKSNKKIQKITHPNRPNNFPKLKQLKLRPITLLFAVIIGNNRIYRTKIPRTNKRACYHRT